MGEDNANDKQGVNKGHKWQPGESGNPKGRPPKGQAITDVIRAMMDEKPEIKRALSAKLLELALGGDLAAINAVMDRLEGRPIAKQEVSGIDGEPLVIVTGNANKP